VDRPRGLRPGRQDPDVARTDVERLRLTFGLEILPRVPDIDLPFHFNFAFATDTFDDGTTLDVGPGDIGILPRGAQTTWTVHEDLRKVYVIRSDP
jgi:hypothetical protein